LDDVGSDEEMSIASGALSTPNAAPAIAPSASGEAPESFSNWSALGRNEWAGRRRLLKVIPSGQESRIGVEHSRTACGIVSHRHDGLSRGKTSTFRDPVELTPPPSTTVKKIIQEILSFLIVVVFGTVSRAYYHFWIIYYQE
jgi:hypothetical protein